MLVVNPHKLFPHLHRCSAEVNRPQLISLNGRPGLFPGTQMPLLRHLLNCSLFLRTSGKQQDQLGFSDWHLSLFLLTRVELLARSCSDGSPGVECLPAAQGHPGDPFPDPCGRSPHHSPTNQPTYVRTTRHRQIFLSGDCSTTLWPSVCLGW